MRLDILLLACLPTETVCKNTTLEDAVKFLGVPNFVTMHTNTRFDNRVFNSSKVVLETVFENK